MLEKLIQQGRSKRKAEGVRGWYVEALSDARTTLVRFCSILILAAAVLDIAIHRKDKDPLSELHIYICEETQDFGTGDLADLFAKLITALRDQRLS